MRIIRKASNIQKVTFYLDYEYLDLPGAGFSFPCTEQGGVDLTEYAAKNYQACQEGSVNGHRVTFRGIKKHVRVHMLPAVGLCRCGREVTLHGFTNTCQCGKDYNWAGQLLAPRSQWGEETGESLADILSI